jgi:hypothetical protein
VRTDRAMISHWIAVIVLVLIVAGGMALAWPHRKNPKTGLGADVNGPGSEISSGDHHHGGDGFSAHD